MFPTLLSNRIDAFKLKDCKFALEKEKESTARIVMFNELSIINSFTLEASFFGTEPEEPNYDDEYFNDEEEVAILSEEESKNNNEESEINSPDIIPSKNKQKELQ